MKRSNKLKIISFVMSFVFVFRLYVFPQQISVLKLNLSGIRLRNQSLIRLY